LLRGDKDRLTEEDISLAGALTRPTDARSAQSPQLRCGEDTRRSKEHSGEDTSDRIK